MKFFARARSTAVFLSTLAAASCGSETDFSEFDEGEIGEHTSAIINGTAAVAENSSWVMITSATTLCSGTLLTNDWVLTNSSCGFHAGDTVTMGSQSRTIKRVIDHPDVGTGVTVAMVQLNSPMIMNGATFGFRRAIQLNLLAVGTSVTCFGYGDNTFTSGAGTLRSAVLTIQSSANNLYLFFPNGAGQIPWLGDAGGGCLTAGGSAMTVHRRAQSSGQQVISADGITSPMYAFWANSIIDGSWFFNPLSTITGAPLAASDPHGYVQNSNRFVVYRAATTNHIIELAFSNGQITVTNLTQPLGSPAAASAPFGYVENNTRHVIYRASNNHIIELWNAGAGWNHVDLTAQSGGTNASGDPVAYMFGGKQHVIYRGSGSHIHSLVFTLNQGWAHTNITSGIGAPTSASDPAAYVFNNEQKIVYRGSDNHIYEMWNLGNGWSAGDVSLPIQAPYAAGDPSAYVLGGQQHIIYRATNNHVIELWGGIGGWNVNDFSVSAGAPNAAGDPKGYASTFHGQQSIVYRVGNANSGDIVHLNGGVNGNFLLENVTDESGAPSQFAPAGTPAGMWHDSFTRKQVYYRNTIGQLFEMFTPRN
jgi:hypothetical protein